MYLWLPLPDSFTKWISFFFFFPCILWYLYSSIKIHYYVYHLLYIVVCTILFDHNHSITCRICISCPIFLLLTQCYSTKGLGQVTDKFQKECVIVFCLEFCLWSPLKVLPFLHWEIREMRGMLQKDFSAYLNHRSKWSSQIKEIIPHLCLKYFYRDKFSDHLQVSCCRVLWIWKRKFN